MACIGQLPVHCGVGAVSILKERSELPQQLWPIGDVTGRYIYHLPRRTARRPVAELPQIGAPTDATFWIGRDNGATDRYHVRLAVGALQQFGPIWSSDAIGVDECDY